MAVVDAQFTFESYSFGIKSLAHSFVGNAEKTSTAYKRWSSAALPLCARILVL